MLQGGILLFFVSEGSANQGALYNVFVLLLHISIHFSYINVCFVASCSGGWCTPWLSALLGRALLWRWSLGGGAQYSMQDLFIFYFSGGHQSGCSLQYIMVLIIFILVFIFTCSFLLGRGFFRSGCGSVPRSITQPLCCGNFREIKFFWATRRL